MAAAVAVVDLSAHPAGKERLSGIAAFQARHQLFDAEEALFEKLESLYESLPMHSPERSLVAAQQRDLHRLIRLQRDTRIAAFAQIAARRE